MRVEDQVELQFMNTVTMLELRKNAESVIRRVQKGQRIILTYRGKPVARLEPVTTDKPDAADPFYRLADLAQERGSNLTNADIDRIVYGG
jgi:prevent-host-death family protein